MARLIPVVDRWFGISVKKHPLNVEKASPFHAIDREGRTCDIEIAKGLSGASLPRSVLVDRDGRIIAADEDLRGLALENLLQELLASPPKN